MKKTQSVVVEITLEEVREAFHVPVTALCESMGAEGLKFSYQEEPKKRGRPRGKRAPKRPNTESAAQ